MAVFGAADADIVDFAELFAPVFAAEDDSVGAAGRAEGMEEDPGTLMREEF